MNVCVHMKQIQKDRKGRKLFDAVENVIKLKINEMSFPNTKRKPKPNYEFMECKSWFGCSCCAAANEMDIYMRAK